MKLQRLTNSSDFTLKLVIVSLLMVVAILTRLMPHPANFTSVAAVALLGGSILPRKWALSLPLLVMVISDLIIGLHPLILYTWGSFALIALGSQLFMKRLNPITVVTASLSSSIFFYVVTNFGVWLQGQMYPLTSAGLVQCYYNAIPFFRNTMLGDLVYSTVLFSVYAVVYHALKSHQPAASTVISR